MILPKELQDKMQALNDFQSASAKINYLLEACREIQYTRPDVAYYFSDTARQIARDEKLTGQETHCLRMNGICKFAAHEYADALKIFQNALSRYVRAKDKLGAAKTHQNIGATFRAMGDVESAIREYRLTEEYCRTNGDKELLMTVLNNLGALFTTLNRPKEALESYSECLSIAERLDNAVIRARITGNIAELYESLGDDATGIEWSQRSLALHRSNSDAMGIALTLANLGRHYWRRGDIDKALTMLTESLTVMSTLKDDHSTARIMSVLGQVFLEKGLVSKAEAMVQGAASIFRTANDIEREIPCLLTLSDISKKRKHQSESLKYLLLAKKRSKEIHNPVLLVDIERKMADAAHRSGNWTKSIRHLNTAVGLSSKNKMHDLTSQIHRQLSDNHARNGNLKKALAHERMASVARATFDSEIRANHAKALQMQLDLERMLRERERAKQQNERLATELSVKAHKINVNVIALAQINGILSELMKGIQRIMSAPSKNRRKLLRETLNKLEMQRLRSQDWNNLSEKLVEVHDSFIQNLTRIIPTVSPTELKVASLVKLDLRSKQIAELLNVGVASVEVYRYRLRQKLNLPAQVRLAMFLQKLD